MGFTDEVADLNPGVRIRAGDPRAKKKRRPIRVFSFEEMHAFAKAAGRYEAMVRVFTDTGMRLGEVLPLRREDFDGETIKVRRTAHEGQILEGTKTDHGEQDAGRIWRERNFYRDLWKSAQQASGLDIRPHECRHSYVTHLRAAGINDADLAETPATASRRCWRGTRMRSAQALEAFAEPSNEPTRNTPCSLSAAGFPIVV